MTMALAVQLLDFSPVMEYEIDNGDLAMAALLAVYCYTPDRPEESIYTDPGRQRPRWRRPRLLNLLASLGVNVSNRLRFWKNDLGFVETASILR